MNLTLILSFGALAVSLLTIVGLVAFAKYRMPALARAALADHMARGGLLWKGPINTSAQGTSAAAIRAQREAEGRLLSAGITRFAAENKPNAIRRGADGGLTTLPPLREED